MNELQGRTLFVPEMDYGGARVLAASFRSVGISSQVVPPSNSFSNALGAKCTSGDECYPTKITLGDFLAILERGDVPPEKAAFFMATADGPCRFGQYQVFMRKTLDQMGYPNVPVFSLTSRNAYHGMGGWFERTTWRGIVAADILRKYLLSIRPYEKYAGDTDGVFQESIEELCKIIEKPDPKLKVQYKEIMNVLYNASKKFNTIATHKKGTFPLIAVVGEIFCRLNTFSNQDIIRVLEKRGAECWLTGVAEWIMYTNADEIRRLKEKKQRFSKAYLKAIAKRFIIRRDEHKMYAPFMSDFKGREDPCVDDLLKLSLKYLPWFGSLGEMTLSAAGAVYAHRKGCAGVVDISSFGCMNEIVAESVFPKISSDLGNFPIKVFYFDGTIQNLDRDVDIFLELARNYRKEV